jgi:hypothetical protein
MSYTIEMTPNIPIFDQNLDIPFAADMSSFYGR